MEGVHNGAYRIFEKTWLSEEEKDSFEDSQAT